MPWVFFVIVAVVAPLVWIALTYLRAREGPPRHD